MKGGGLQKPPVQPVSCCVYISSVYSGVLYISVSVHFSFTLSVGVSEGCFRNDFMTQKLVIIRNGEKWHLRNIGSNPQLSFLNHRDSILLLFVIQMERKAVLSSLWESASPGFISLHFKGICLTY